MKPVATRSLRFFLLSLIWLLTTFDALAQPPAGGGPPKFAAGEIIGIIHDSLSGNPVEYATIAVINLKDTSVVGGGVAGKNGEFVIKNLPAGKMQLRINFFGYKTLLSKVVQITPQQPQADLGILLLPALSKQLGDVVIEDDKAEYTSNIDKKVYEVDKSITNAGGTATDVLQNIPSVNVDMDGNISLRGTENVTILIDGKPSGLTGSDRQAVLQQIPASMIERIEVVTNPSAKYDAQGMGGIINIVTKKGTEKGFNGSVTAGVGTNNKYNAGVNLNHRGPKLNWYANYNFRAEDRWSEKLGKQHTYTADTNYYFISDGGGLNQSIFHSGKIGGDLYLSPYTTLSLGLGGNLRGEDKQDSTIYSYLDSLEHQYGGLSRYSLSREDQQGYDANLDFRHTWPGSKKMFTLSGSYSNNDRTEKAKYANYAFVEPALAAQLNNSIINNKAIVAQADYSHPFNDSMKLEGGLKYTLRQYDSQQNSSLLDFIVGTYNNDPRFTDRFLYDESVYAGYLQYGMHIRKFDFQAGVRAEYTDLTGKSESTSTTFVSEYLSLFPSGTVRFTPKYGVEFQLGYSRRLNRPDNRSLNPYIDYSDSINIRTGNPYLRPEFIQSIDFSFTKTWEALTLNASTYYRHTDNLITHYRRFDVNTGIGTVTSQNFGSSDNIGLEFVLRYQLPKRKGNIMFTATGFRNMIDASNLEAGLQSEALNGSVRLSATYKVMPMTSLQLTGMYNSPFYQPVGSFQMLPGFDIGVRQELLKGRATATLNLTDVMDTRGMRMTNFSDNYDFQMRRKRETRVLTFTFTWRFGKGEESKSQKRNQQTQPGGGDDSQMGF